MLWQSPWWFSKTSKTGASKGLKGRWSLSEILWQCLHRLGMLCGDSDEKNHLLLPHKRKWRNREQNLGQSVRVRWSFPIQKTSQLEKLTHLTTIKEVSWGFVCLFLFFAWEPVASNCPEYCISFQRGYPVRTHRPLHTARMQESLIHHKGWKELGETHPWLTPWAGLARISCAQEWRQNSLNLCSSPSLLLSKYHFGE